MLYTFIIYELTLDLLASIFQPTNLPNPLISNLNFLNIRMSQWHVIELGECHLQDNETVLLRWQFDITPSDTNTVFTILKGRCTDKKDLRDADAVLKQRLVQGGAGGEVQGAFAVKNACTLVWSNANAWIRPRSIKYTVDAFAVM